MCSYFSSIGGYANQKRSRTLVLQHNLMLSSTTRSLNHSPTTNVTARLPEDVSEALFCDGYDSDGKLPNIPDMEDDLQALEDYNNMPIGRESRVNEGVGGNGEVQEDGINGNVDGDEADGNFIFLSDDNIKKLKVDGLRKE